MAKSAADFSFPYFTPTGTPAISSADIWNVTKLPSFKGLDLTTGKSVDLGQFKTPDTANAIPDLSPALKSYQDYLAAAYPYQKQQMIDAAQIQAGLSQEQLQTSYPWIAAAAAQARQGNLAASEAYRAFAESQPSNVQNIMASKQAQMTSAAGAEADRARAMAAQQQAAKQFAGQFSGKYVSYA